ncbi:GNAT family N-acetyltransferase [Ochrobactrum sp. AN78]|uniref:GNAT family N-acetyltransferase n=1 Tax=Ochrobactrum sp. AN78 TaxID=3039853 RepID=UPI002989AC20|nr:GNAT family N-acetyltransferase [Ochrobactrum sp. AN78]MDH7793607.1 diamine N-acetyltransferase [Ochrobactrum sp. AN78]
MTKPPHTPIHVELVAVTEAIRSRVVALQLAAGQHDLVASNQDSLLEADEDPDARPRAILVDGNLVGFLMYDASSEPATAQLYRLMIDRRYQGRGYGFAAIEAFLTEIKSIAAVNQVSICYEPENLAARQLYAKAGFVEQGIDADGEMIAIFGCKV